jgi:HlyD family secretion protein
VEWLGDSVTEEKIAQVAFDALPEGVALGELAEVTLRLPPVNNVLTLPNAAVRYLAGQPGVWQVTDQGAAQFQPLRFGIRTLDGVAQLLDPLPPDARIIVYSEREVRAGEAVEIRDSLNGVAR